MNDPRDPEQQPAAPAPLAEPSTSDEGPSGLSKRSTRLVIGGVLVALLVVVIAVVAFGTFIGPADDEAVKLVPADAIGYVNVFLDPSISQKRALQDLLEHFPEAPTPDEARKEIIELIDRGLEEIDANFEDDVEPWLGRQVAGFFLEPSAPGQEPSGAALVAARDDAEALAFLDRAAEAQPGEVEEATYEGVDHLIVEGGSVSLGLVDGFVVVGDERGFEAAVDTTQGGEDLQSSERYQDVFGELAEDGLAAFYIDGERLWAWIADELESTQTELPPGMLDDSWEVVAGVASVTGDSAVIESVMDLREGEENMDMATAFGQGTKLLAQMPAGSWGIVGLPDFGTTVDMFIDLMVDMQPPGQGSFTRGDLEREMTAATGLDLDRDVLSWMDDAAMFITGNTLENLSGGMVIETDNPDRAAGTLRKLSELAERDGAPVQELRIGDSEGFSIQDPTIPQEIALVTGLDRVVATYGLEAARGALGEGDGLQMSQDPGYRAAQEALGDVDVGAYFDIAAILALAESAGADTDGTYREDVKPWLEPLGFFTFGSSIDDRRIKQRMVVGIDERSSGLAIAD